MSEEDPSIYAMRLRGIEVGFGPRTIIKNLDLDVKRGEILGFVGASGTGKTVLTRAVLGLVQKRAGRVELLGEPYDQLRGREKAEVDKRVGVLFQHGALFSSLTVKQNIQVPMREYLDLSQDAMDALTAIKLAMVGLKPEAAQRMPSELSGGMIKRAALARALALDPQIVFLDEPTSGLDPIGSAAFDDLIRDLRNALGLTVFMVTHDLDSLFSVCDRIAVLGEGRILVAGTLEEVRGYDHPWVREYFVEGRAAARNR